MHNLEVSETGLIRGWVSGAPNGAPGRLDIVSDGGRCTLAASTERPDVLAAGRTLFSGFCYTFTAPPGHGDISLQIENESYGLVAEERRDESFLRIDAITKSTFEGWIDLEGPLESVWFSDGSTTHFPDVLARPDVAALKNMGTSDRFGFRLAAKNFDDVRFCVVNNAHIHVFSPRFLSAGRLS